MTQHDKNYRNARAEIDREELYSPAQAVRMLKSWPELKFDETVEVHFNLGLNVRHADQQLRGTLMLPHGTGREARVAVFAEGDKAREAQEAGADVVGTADLAQQIAETKLEDLNARDVEHAMRIVAGTARSMGVETDIG